MRKFLRTNLLLVIIMVLGIGLTGSICDNSSEPDPIPTPTPTQGPTSTTLVDTTLSLTASTTCGSEDYCEYVNFIPNSAGKLITITASGTDNMKLHLKVSDGGENSGMGSVTYSFTPTQIIYYSVRVWDENNVGGVITVFASQAL
jgi:hypothetical protein